MYFFYKFDKFINDTESKKVLFCFLFKVDGNFTEWTPWGSCDKSCGLGTKLRQRWCTNPPPSAGGRDCVGESLETQECNDFPCPGLFIYLLKI